MPREINTREEIKQMMQVIEIRTKSMIQKEIIKLIHTQSGVE